MRNKTIFLLKYYLYWILLSAVARGVFMLYEPQVVGDGSVVVTCFWKGLRMDLSLGGYIMMLAALFMAVAPFVTMRFVRRVYAIYTAVLLLIFWLVCVADLELYASWGYHIDASVLLFVGTPGEAVASLSNGMLIGLVLLMTALVAGSYMLYKYVIACSLQELKGTWRESVLFVLLAGAMVIPVRGGFNVAPMNSSFVFFHPTNMHANMAAVNPVWNFMYETTHAGRLKHTYRYMPDERAAAIVDSLYSGRGETPKWLTSRRPNIVLLLLESFTADAVGVLGGEKGVTPHLDSIAKGGVLFSNIYATGNRSDRGLAGVVSAYPAYPAYSLLKYPKKITEHPRFTKQLEAIGYHTRFYYAGDLNFGGFRSYTTMSFQEEVTEDDFTGKAVKNRFKWGMHDEYMFARLHEDMCKADTPFVYMAFNLSSHEPFDVPMERRIMGETIESKFLNAICYSDSCIGNFIEDCKKSGLWDNTLFVFVADHGTIKIGHPDPYGLQAFHIPLVLAGGVLTVSDTVVPTIGSQTDVVATLFGLLGLDYSAYRFSKNLLAAGAKPFAYYAYSGACGFVSDKGVSILNLQNGHFLESAPSEGNDEALKAYLQLVDEDINREPMRP